MPPRKDQVLTPAAVVAGLGSADAAQQTAMLQLLAATPALSMPQAQAELAQLGLSAQLLNLLQGAEKSVALLASRQLAVYAATPDSSICQAFTTNEIVQTLWSVLQSYQASQEAIAAALADPAAAKVAAAAGTKRLPGSKEPIDPDDWLPGPSKHLLEAVLRALCSLEAAAHTTAAGGVVGCQQPGSTAAATADASGTSSIPVWLSQQPASTLVALLAHPSGRVQMRAARLAVQLSRSASWCNAFAASGGVAAVLQLAGVASNSPSSRAPGSPANSSTSSSPVTSSSSPSAQLAALRLLHRLVNGPSGTARAAAVSDSLQLLRGLMVVLLQPGPVGAAGDGTPPAAAAAVAAGVGAKAKAAHADMAKASASRELALMVQQAAAGVLACICSTSAAISGQLLQRGGVTALSSLLPDAPSWQQGPRGSGCWVQSMQHKRDQTVVADHASSVPGQVVPPLPLNADEHHAASGPVQRPPAAQASQPPPVMPDGAADGQHTMTPGTPSPARAGVAFQAPLGVKALNTDLQAKLLEVLAAVLCHPEVVAALQEVAAPLTRQLLHLFAGCEPPEAAADASVSMCGGGSSSRSNNGSSGGQDTAAAGRSGAAAGSSGNGKAGTHTPRGSGTGASAPLKGLVVGLNAAGESALATGAAPTPRKPPTTAVSTNNKAPDAATGALSASLVPPFAAGVKVAALACLSHLASSPATLQHVFQQQLHQSPPQDPPCTPGSSGSSSRSSNIGIAREQVCGRPQEQQHQQVEEEAGPVVIAADKAGTRKAFHTMLHQVLVDIQQISGAAMAGSSMTGGNIGEGIDGSADGGSSSSSSSSNAAPPAGLLEAAADFLAALCGGLAEHDILQLPTLQTLQAVACSADAHQAPARVQHAVSNALLLLPEQALLPPPRPPLPSPPPTPPPPPLPTSLFAWDALGRPCLTDGSVLVGGSA